MLSIKTRPSQLISKAGWWKREAETATGVVFTNPGSDLSLEYKRKKLGTSITIIQEEIIYTMNKGRGKEGERENTRMRRNYWGGIEGQQPRHQQSTNRSHSRATSQEY